MVSVTWNLVLSVRDEVAEKGMFHRAVFASNEDRAKAEGDFFEQMELDNRFLRLGPDANGNTLCLAARSTISVHTRREDPNEVVSLAGEDYVREGNTLCPKRWFDDKPAASASVN